jgi:hypothetical protein
MQVDSCLGEDDILAGDHDVAGHEDVDFNTHSHTMERVDEDIQSTHVEAQATQVRSRSLFDLLFFLSSSR